MQLDIKTSKWLQMSLATILCTDQHLQSLVPGLVKLEFDKTRRLLLLTNGVHIWTRAGEMLTNVLSKRLPFHSAESFQLLLGKRRGWMTRAPVLGVRGFGFYSHLYHWAAVGMQFLPLFLLCECRSFHFRPGLVPSLVLLGASERLVGTMRKRSSF